MKLNTLLLTSVATLMATSAFAADLPSKKAAPALGAVQVCKVGGMTGFTLPGSDTCLGISGFARFDANYNLNSESDDEELDWVGASGGAWGGLARVNFDARSNTEIGVVRSFIGLEGGSSAIAADRAYVQFSGITAGRKDSIANVYGGQSEYGILRDVEEEGVDYQVKLGDLNFGIGLEAPNNNNDGGASESADNPDFVAHLSGKMGSVGFAAAAVSHQAVDWDDETANGYALMGNINVTTNGLRAGVFGGMTENASAYTGGTTATGGSLFDFDDDLDLETTILGGNLVYSTGKMTLGAEYTIHNADDSVTEIDTTQLALFAGYSIAKGLSLYTEYYTQEIERNGVANEADDVDAILFRIQRDF